MKAKIVLGAVILASGLLAGCSSSNNAQLDQISSDVNRLNTQVQQLSSDVQSANAQAKAAYEAARANQRLDNQVTTYKK
uniref:Major outer membrane lipoprotein Lpp n=1 Tax=Proteus mirabilis TaxID=584 RepID=LPP_PROMI|nr:RecName: Full=Major outer membrane lipoprotein Lpp; Flags: Precursor [Proteus mirabilis]AAA25658.1 lipoprotein [Proteus mirabilis]AAA25659.1 lipoprotein precursor [Proteus mirabilis]